MMPAVWNVAEPLEVEYRRPIHQSSDQSNSGRKEIEKPLCGEETEGQESHHLTAHLMDSTNCKSMCIFAKGIMT